MNNPVSSLPYSAKEAARDIARADNFPYAYACPEGCGCIWRDNHDGSMSLFGPNSKSCKVCEYLPLDKLTPLTVLTKLRPYLKHLTNCACFDDDGVRQKACDCGLEVLIA